MNTSRLVAALAAVAIGFGITLVGVVVADDPAPTESIATESSPEVTQPAPSVEPVPVETATSPTDPVATDAVAADTVPVDSARSQSRDATDAVEPAQGDDASPPRSEPSDRSGAAPSSEFPCSAEAFEVLVDDLTDQEQTALAADTDLFVRVVAKRLASAGSTPADDWEAALQREFDTFTTSACSETDEQVFVEGSQTQFFCSAAHMSADERLFVFLRSFTGNLMATCTYERPQGEN